ncbi:conserved hypothetical protein [Prevotella intermedia]|uniref:Uncharacterized protein n=1 Tax=Prevotella intermedia TaxID=28131 RepID=A0A0S3UHR3_PREIN|nr:conserved hypothetical protein [Prevotella intermedia]
MKLQFAHHKLTYKQIGKMPSNYKEYCNAAKAYLAFPILIIKYNKQMQRKCYQQSSKQGPHLKVFHSISVYYP